MTSMGATNECSAARQLVVVVDRAQRLQHMTALLGKVRRDLHKLSSPVREAGAQITLAFSIVMAVLTSVLFSLAPAFQAAGADPAGAVKEGARSIARGHDAVHWGSRTA
jgi:hypothetical protein